MLKQVESQKVVGDGGIPNLVFFTMGPNTLHFGLDEPVNPANTEMTIWVNKVKFKCYQLPWEQYQELCRKYRNHKPVGIVTGYSIAPGRRKVHLWPLPDRRTDVSFRYGPMLSVVGA